MGPWVGMRLPGGRQGKPQPAFEPIIAILATLALAWALAAVKGSWTANQKQLFLSLARVSLEMSKFSWHWPSSPGNG